MDLLCDLCDYADGVSNNYCLSMHIVSKNKVILSGDTFVEKINGILQHHQNSVVDSRFVVCLRSK